MELDPALAGVVFFSSMGIDALAAYYTRATANGEAGRATTASVAMALLGWINIAAFMGNQAYAIPEIVGGAIGTYVIVRAGRSSIRP